MSQNRFWYLLAKKLSGEALPEELSELERLLREDPELIYTTEHLEGLFKLKSQEQDQYDAELAFELHLNQLKQQGVSLTELETPADLDPVPAPRRRKTLLVLSALVLVLVMA